MTTCDLNLKPSETWLELGTQEKAAQLLSVPTYADLLDKDDADSDANDDDAGCAGTRKKSSLIKKQSCLAPQNGKMDS